MLKLVRLARGRRLFVMEDCALALGSKIDGVHAGLLGDCGVFSFYPVKHMTTAEGGMVILRDSKLAEALRLKKAFGVDRAHGERKVPGVYDVVELGFNYRMSEIHAAIGIEQLKKVPDFLRRRRANAETLAAALAAVEGIRLLPSSTPRLTGSYYCSAALLDPELASKRPQIITAMSARGVGTSVYYPQPVPRMTYYARKYGWKDGSFPNAERVADHSIALSVGPHLDGDDMEFIAASLDAAIRSL
jgi:perosamine synthetase